MPDAEPGDALPDLPVRRARRAALLRRGQPADDLEGPGHHDVAAMIYTSGTTGPSKGVLVPWAELYEFVRLPPDGMIEDGGSYYTVYPAFHVSGKSSLYMSARYHGHLVSARRSASPSSGTTSARYDIRAAGLVGPIAALLMLAPPAARRTPTRRSRTSSWARSSRRSRSSRPASACGSAPASA